MNKERAFLQVRAGQWAVVILLALIPAAPAAEPTVKNKPPALLVTAGSPRGFFTNPAAVRFESPVEGAVIRFTGDGSEPTATHGTVFSAPLVLTNTTLLRAAAFKAGRRVTEIETRSHIFLDQVMHQPKEPPGYPAGQRAWNGQPAAYQMDPRVVNDPAYRDRMTGAFQSLPVVSVVCRQNDLFGPKGLYLNTEQRGDKWEKPCSVEMVLPDGNIAFQIDCGLRIQGNYNRRPDRSPKHSFRIVFKEQYGAGKLHYQMFPDSPVKKFDTLVLRADYNNSWIHWDPQARPRAQRTRDAWMKDSARAMGWTAGHNRYVHLFLNGLYWGVYDFAERPDANFAASYLGGSKEDYDVINEFQAKDGTMDAFDKLRSVHALSRNEQLQKLTRLLDLTNYIDYLLLNYYAGNQDWGENKNWYAIHPRATGGLFQYIVWDGEQVLHDVTDDCVSNSYETPFRLAEELKKNAEFQLLFADRVQKHFFNDGALTPPAAITRWMKRAEEVDVAMIAESARWGYYRRNPPYTHDRDWAAEQRRLVMSYFPQRTGLVLGQLRAVGLYPKIEAPVLHQHGGRVADGFKLAIAAPAGGKVYFTTNGTDPRVAFTGEVAAHATAYSEPILLPVPSAVKSRVLKGGAWSAMSEAGFARDAAPH